MSRYIIIVVLLNSLLQFTFSQSLIRSDSTVNIQVEILAGLTQFHHIGIENNMKSFKDNSHLPNYSNYDIPPSGFGKDMIYDITFLIPLNDRLLSGIQIQEYSTGSYYHFSSFLEQAVTTNELEYNLSQISFYGILDYKFCKDVGTPLQFSIRGGAGASYAKLIKDLHLSEGLITSDPYYNLLIDAVHIRGQVHRYHA